MREITDSEIKELAELYDRFAHAIDPFSEDRDRAETLFYRKLEALRCSIAPNLKNHLEKQEFTRGIIRRLRQYLKKN